MGLLSFFGGASSAETNAANNVSNYSAGLEQWARNNYGEQQASFKQLQDALNPMIAGGPNQAGYNAPTLAALNTEALDTTAGAYANAARAAGTSLAGRGGGISTGPEGGVEAQIRGSLAGEAAGQLSGEQLGITKSNYALGHQNYETALGQEGDLARMENPGGYANSALSGAQSSFGDQKQIQKQNSQALGSLLSTGLSFAGPIAGAIKGGIGNLDSTGSSSFGEQIGNFFSGASQGNG